MTRVVFINLHKMEDSMRATAKMFSLIGAKKLGKHNGRKIYRYRGMSYVETKEVITQKLGTGETISGRYMVTTEHGNFFNIGKREARLLFPQVNWEFIMKYVDNREVVEKKSIVDKIKTFISGEK